MPNTSLALLQDQLQDAIDRSVFWTREEARLAFNEGLRLWNLYTGRWRGKLTLLTVANRVYYDLPATLLQTTIVAIESRPLAFSDLYGLDYAHPHWESETTASGGEVPSRVDTWAPHGLTRLAIWPADAVGNKLMVVDGVRETPVLRVPQDVVDLDPPELAHLLAYAAHILSFKVGGAVFEATLPDLDAFLVAAAEENERLKLATWYRQAAGIVRPPSRPIQPVGEGVE